MDVWVCIILALMGVDSDGEWNCRIPVTGGRGLLSGKHVDHQAGHNDFPARRNLCPGYFIIVTGNDAVTLWLTKSSYHYVWYSEEDLKGLADIMVMSQILIRPNSIFIGHGYLQHAGSGWCGFASLRYHMYLIPDDLLLPDAIHFAYHELFRRYNQPRNEGDHQDDPGGSEDETRPAIKRNRMKIIDDDDDSDESEEDDDDGYISDDEILLHADDQESGSTKKVKKVPQI